MECLMISSNFFFKTKHIYISMIETTNATGSVKSMNWVKTWLEVKRCVSEDHIHWWADFDKLLFFFSFSRYRNFMFYLYLLTSHFTLFVWLFVSIICATANSRSETMLKVQKKKENVDVMWLMWCMICHLTDCSLARWQIFFFVLILSSIFEWAGVPFIEIDICKFVFRTKIRVHYSKIG